MEIVVRMIICSSVLFLVCLTIGACSTKVVQNKNLPEESPPTVESLCKDSTERESLETHRISKSVEVIHGLRFAVADPPDEGYPFTCGMQYIVEIQWKMDGVTLKKVVTENLVCSLAGGCDRFSDVTFYDAKLKKSTLNIILQTSRDLKISELFHLNTKSKKIESLSSEK